MVAAFAALDFLTADFVRAPPPPPCFLLPGSHRFFAGCGAVGGGGEPHDHSWLAACGAGKILLAGTTPVPAEEEVERVAASFCTAASAAPGPPSCAVMRAAAAMSKPRRSRAGVMVGLPAAAAPPLAGAAVLDFGAIFAAALLPTEAAEPACGLFRGDDPRPPLGDVGRALDARRAGEVLARDGRGAGAGDLDCRRDGDRLAGGIALMKF